MYLGAQGVGIEIQGQSSPKKKGPQNDLETFSSSKSFFLSNP